MASANTIPEAGAAVAATVPTRIVAALAYTASQVRRALRLRAALIVRLNA